MFQPGDVVKVVSSTSIFEYEIGVVIEASDEAFGVKIQFIRENSLNGKQMGFYPSELEIFNG
jgi:hypothetical protein